MAYEEKREGGIGSLIWPMLIGALIMFMIMMTIHQRQEREHIAESHPEMLKEYDEVRHGMDMEMRTEYGH